uniref:Uncharacterized protein n=1 Tax=Protobothrops flavoviridis TaxID=88087 RepID=T2HQG4_PROFL|nr:hypothetical protein [Protobothrops flavoviridis]
MINKLQDSKGELQFQNDTIKKIIKNYYEILYKAEEIPKEKIQQYLKKADLPKNSG